MKINILPVLISLVFSSFAYASDIMVERMQSVVDEVTELRLRYEKSAADNKACLEQVEKQNKRLKEISRGEGLDYRVFEENRKRLAILEAENQKLKKTPKAEGSDEKVLALKKDVEAFVKENRSLRSSVQNLEEKNDSLLSQLDKLKSTPDGHSEKKLLTLEGELARVRRENKELQGEIKVLESQISEAKKNQFADSVSKAEYRALQAENIRLEKELKTSGTRESKAKKRNGLQAVCPDDNPFPKLMMKKDEKPRPHAPQAKPVIQVKTGTAGSHKSEPIMMVTEKASAYRMRREGEIYDAPNGEVIALWEEKTSFTSNISKGDWIKITGYFVDQKWRRSTEEMWLKAKDTIKR